MSQNHEAEFMPISHYFTSKNTKGNASDVDLGDFYYASNRFGLTFVFNGKTMVKIVKKVSKLVTNSVLSTKIFGEKNFAWNCSALIGM